MDRRSLLQNLRGAPQFWAGLAISAVALWVAFRGLDFQSLATALADADYRLLPLAVLAVVAALYLRALRWRMLFHPIRGLPILHLFGAVNVGYLFNNILPLRAGEVARVYVVHRKARVSAFRTLSTVVVERLIDIIAVAGTLIVVSPFVDEPAWLFTTGWLAGGAALLIVVVLASAGRPDSWGQRLAYWTIRRLPVAWQSSARDAVGAATAGLSAIRSPTALAWVALFTVGAWLATALAMYFVLMAFSLSGGFTAALYVAAATTLSTVIPAAPGYVGVFHVAAATVMREIFGASDGGAAGFALVLYGLVYLTPVTLGLGYLWINRDLVADLLPRLGRPRPAAVDENDTCEKPRADSSLPSAEP